MLGDLGNPTACRPQAAEDSWRLRRQGNNRSRARVRQLGWGENDRRLDQSMAAPTSLSPNFCELPIPDPVTLCHDRRKALEINQVCGYRRVGLTLFLPKKEGRPARPALLSRLAANRLLQQEHLLRLYHVPGLEAIQIHSGRNRASCLIRATPLDAIRSG
jgi:hypothetical protein